MKKIERLFTLCAEYKNLQEEINFLRQKVEYFLENENINFEIYVDEVKQENSNKDSFAEYKSQLQGFFKILDSMESKVSGTVKIPIDNNDLITFYSYLIRKKETQKFSLKNEISKISQK